MRRPHSLLNRARRAFTLVEMMIVVALFTLVGGFVAYLTLEIGYQFRQTISQIPAQEQAFRTMTFIRSELLPADASSLEFGEDGEWVQFDNLARGATCRIAFEEVDGQRRCVYYPDVESDESRPWGRGVQGSFALIDGVRRVAVVVRTRARDRNNETLIYSYRDEVTLRN